MLGKSSKMVFGLWFTMVQSVKPSTKLPPKHPRSTRWWCFSLTKKTISGPKVWYGARCKCRIHAKSKTKVSPGPTVLFVFFSSRPTVPSEQHDTTETKIAMEYYAASLGSLCSSLRHYHPTTCRKLASFINITLWNINMLNPKMEVWFRWSSFSIEWFFKFQPLIFQEVVNWNKSTPVFGELVVWTLKDGEGEGQFIKKIKVLQVYIYIPTIVHLAVLQTMFLLVDKLQFHLISNRTSQWNGDITTCAELYNRHDM